MQKDRHFQPLGGLQKQHSATKDCEYDSGLGNKHRTYQCGTASHNLTRYCGPLGVGRRIRERAVEVRLQTRVERPQDRVQLQGRERDQRSGRVSSRGRSRSRGGGDSS